MILIQSPDGTERCLVESTNGHEDWTVLAEDVDMPGDDDDWDEEAGTWRRDPEKRQKRLARRAMRQISRNPEDVMLWMLKEIRDLRNEIEALKGN